MIKLIEAWLNTNWCITSCTWLYFYINYLNSFLINSRAKTRVKAGADSKSGPRDLKIADTGILGVLLPCVVLSSGVKSQSHLLKIIKLC